MASGTNIENFEGNQTLRGDSTEPSLSLQALDLFKPLDRTIQGLSSQSVEKKEEQFFKLLAITDRSLEIDKKPPEKAKYPELPTTQRETIGGQDVVVANPAWNKDTKERRDFIKAQNEISDKAIDPVMRHTLADRLNKLMDYEWRGNEVYTTKNGASFSFTNNGKQNRDVLIRQEADGRKSVVLDPNEFKENIYLSGTSPSPDGRYVAYATSNGSDWNNWKIRDTQTGKDLDDSTNWTKFSTVTWAADGKGYYYTRLPEPQKGEEITAKNENWTMMYHKIGDKQEQDRVVVKPEDPKTFVSGSETEDGRYLISYTQNGTGDSVGVRVSDLKNPDKPPVILSTTDNGSRTVVIGNEGSTFYLKTDKDAPNGKVIAIDINDPTKVKELIAQPKNFTITEVAKAGNNLVVSGLRDGQSVVNIYDSNGKLSREVELPGAGRISAISTREGSDSVRFAYSSMTQPNTLMELDTKSGELKTTFAPKVNYNPNDYVTELKYVPNGDGQEIPMYIARRKDLPLDGKNPVDMRVYGGFNAEPANQFSSSNILFLEKGGIIAVPVLRGDGGRNDKWHDDGKGLNKENTYKDAVAAARYLQTNGYSSPETTAITGGSNGGLTVAAVINRNPELFKAAIAEVPVTSLFNYDRPDVNPGGSAWVDEYGKPEDETVAAALRKIDPLNNIRTDGNSPKLLIIGNTLDDRVGLVNTIPYGIEMQKQSNNEVLMLIRGTGGHSGGNDQNSAVKGTTTNVTYLLQRLRSAKP